MDKLRRPRLSLDLLRGFRSAARHLSFTKAAAELFVTQPAISKEIRTLEEQLGQELFEREHRGLKLTRAGEELYRVADEAITALDAVTERLAGTEKVLSVTTTPALASLWLAPRLPRFNQAHPGIDIHIFTSNDRPDLERDRIDVAIRFVNFWDDAPNDEPLFACVNFPVCAPALTRGERALRTPADLANTVRLDYEAMRDGRRISEWEVWFEVMKLEPVKPASTLRFPQYDQAVGAAALAQGVAMGVTPHVTNKLRDGSLCAPFGPEAVIRRGDFFIVIRRDVVGREAVEAFVSWLREEARLDGPAVPVPARRASKGIA
jgi:DNA-binding transcriptional LysR family regulator